MRECLFIWVPKCAGTSIYEVLGRHGCRKLKKPREFSVFDNRGSVTFDHVSVAALLGEGYVSRKYLDGVFKFAFVRNPWDRLVSLWSYFTENVLVLKIKLDFSEFVLRVLEGVEPVGLYNRRGLSQARLMCDWLFDNDGNLLVDFIGRVEESKDWKEIKRLLEIGDDFPILNTTGHSCYREYYTPESRRLVAKIYERDIEEFGYRF